MPRDCLAVFNTVLELENLQKPSSQTVRRWLLHAPDLKRNQDSCRLPAQLLSLPRPFTVSQHQVLHRLHPSHLLGDPLDSCCRICCPWPRQKLSQSIARLSSHQSTPPEPVLCPYSCCRSHGIVHTSRRCSFRSHSCLHSCKHCIHFHHDHHLGQLRSLRGHYRLCGSAWAVQMSSWRLMGGREGMNCQNSGFEDTGARELRQSRGRLLFMISGGQA